MKQVLCSADDKLSNSLPTTSHVGRTKQGLCGCQQSDARNLTAGQRWAPAAAAAADPQAGSRAIEPPVVMLGTSRGITSVV